MLHCQGPVCVNLSRQKYVLSSRRLEIISSKARKGLLLFLFCLVCFCLLAFNLVWVDWLLDCLVGWVGFFVWLGFSGRIVYFCCCCCLFLVMTFKLCINFDIQFLYFIRIFLLFYLVSIFYKSHVNLIYN